MDILTKSQVTKTSNNENSSETDQLKCVTWTKVYNIKNVDKKRITGKLFLKLLEH